MTYFQELMCINIPRNGPRIKNKAADPPAFSRCQISATLPPPIARPAEPRKAAKKRHKRSEVNVSDAPAPTVNARKHVHVPIYTHRRPSVSDKGAINSGPKAMPSV